MLIFRGSCANMFQFHKVQLTQGKFTIKLCASGFQFHKVQLTQFGLSMI